MNIDPAQCTSTVTNRSTCRCSFCARTRGTFRLGSYDLALDHDPDTGEVRKALDAEAYNRICSPVYGAETFHSVVRCIRLARELVPEVGVTAVDEGTVDLEGCRGLAEELGVVFRVR